jgi:large subunit ribosomal protein L10e
MYRQIKGQANTRREYMGGVPLSRITQFDHGNIKGDFPVILTSVAVERCQIRHTALEAGRIAGNRLMSKRAGNMGYHLKIRIFPHNVLRENKQATGAGADRVSQGMRSAFGKTVGTAARVQRGQKLMTIRTTVAQFANAKQALGKAGQKFPTPIRIIIEQGADLVS